MFLLAGLAIHVGICLFPIPQPGGGARGAAEYHFMCLVPAGIAGVALIAAVTGLIVDRSKIAAVLALVLSAGAIFWLLFLDALEGVIAP
jgi:hypothetical protein